MEKGGARPGLAPTATIPRSALRNIAELKLRDLNAASVDGAMKIVEGTARSMGIDITEE